MPAPVSFGDHVWRELALQAVAHGEAPGRRTDRLARAAQDVRDRPWPGGEVYLWGALLRMAEAYAGADLPRRRRLAAPLILWAAACLEALADPPPAAGAAALDLPPRRWRADIDG